MTPFFLDRTSDCVIIRRQRFRWHVWAYTRGHLGGNIPPGAKEFDDPHKALAHAYDPKKALCIESGDGIYIHIAVGEPKPSAYLLNWKRIVKEPAPPPKEPYVGPRTRRNTAKIRPF